MIMVRVPFDETSDIWSFKRPGVAVDVVILSILHNELCVALIQRQDEPYFGSFALPGRFVRYEEPITQTAKKALEIKGNIKSEQVYLRQLKTFGDELVRDTRIRTISIVYYALVSQTIIASQEKSTLTWHPLNKLPKMAFDHEKIALSSVEAIRKRLFQSDAVFHLLPGSFTLTQLQTVYEQVLGEELDKRNFRKKITEFFELKDLKKTTTGGAHRPAKLYSYVKKKN